MSLSAEKSFRMKMRDVETAFKYRRFPYPKRSVELIALLAISCTFFLFMHTNKLNSRLKEMEMKLQPSEFSALGLTGSNHLDSPKREDINTLHGTYQYLKSTGQLSQLKSQLLNNTKLAERDFLLFNRVPKVGSEQLIELIRRLSIANKFQAKRSSPGEPVLYRLNELQQLEWALQFHDMGEAHSYAMHINYIDFRAFELPQPIYINMVRDPVERVISWYFYMRTPWRAVQRYKRVKNFHSPRFYKKDFNQCVRNKDRECLFIQEGKFRDTEASHIRQSLFFCGHNKECEPFNSLAALQRAKHIVETQYAVVGSLEDVNVTLNVLENYIPRYFRGATQMYYAKDSGLFNEKLNANSWKPPIDEQIKNIIRRNFTREYEFYYFCKQRLYKQYLALGNLAF